MSEITTNEIVPAVKATQVHKAFGNLHVLKGIDMTVMPGTGDVIQAVRQRAYRARKERQAEAEAKAARPDTTWASSSPT